MKESHYNMHPHDLAKRVTSRLVTTLANRLQNASGEPVKQLFEDEEKALLMEQEAKELRDKNVQLALEILTKYP